MQEFGRLSDHLGYLLHRTNVRLIGSIAAALSELRLSPARMTAIVYIALNEGCDQMALGRALGINRASTMKVVNNLEALGLVERRAGRDRRSNALHLTERGSVIRVRAEEVTEATDISNFSVLTDEEQRALRRMLEKLLRQQTESRRVTAVEEIEA